MPSEWALKRVKQLVEDKYICTPNDGNHGELHPTSDEYVANGIPFLMASDVQNDRINLNSCNFITKERADKLQKGFAKNGDILFTHKGSVGNVALLIASKTEYVMLTPQVTYYRILNKQMLSVNFFKNYLQSPEFQKDLKIKSKGATRDYIGIVEQQKLLILIPSFLEQEKIAEILTTCDKVIELKEKLISEKQRQKKWLMQNLLTGKKRLKGFTDEWEKVKLGGICDIVKGEQINKNDLTESGEYYALNGGITPSGYTHNWNVKKNTISIRACSII